MEPLIIERSRDMGAEAELEVIKQRNELSVLLSLRFWRIGRLPNLTFVKLIKQELLKRINTFHIHK